MRDRDIISLQEAYEFFIEGSIGDPALLIGKKVEIHPVVRVSPSHDDYMKWSVKVDGSVIGDARNIHLKNCESFINHPLIDKSIRNPLLGRKAPIILLVGEVVDVDFSSMELGKKLSSGDWKSVTYNPHKFSEYVYKDEKLPEWWCKDERFMDVSNRNKEFIAKRNEAMVERDKEKRDLNILSKRVGNKSFFKCKEAIINQHTKCDEDYMWVSGVYY